MTGDRRRVEAVERLRASNSGPVLDRLADEAARLLGAAAGQVSLLADVQIVAGAGGAAAGTTGTRDALEDSLCSLTAAGGRPMALTDARDHAAASDLPPVRAGRVRGYLGVPLIDIDGHVLGSVCVFDPEPRQWTDAQVRLLEMVGRAVGGELQVATLTAEHHAERLRWTLAVDAGEVGSFDWDLLTGRLVWDARLQEIFGFAPGEFDERIESFDARVHPDDAGRVGSAVQTSIDTCGEYEAEYRVVLPGGATRWVQARGKTLCDPLGTATRLLGAAYDTTDTRDSQLRTTRVLEAMPSGFLSLDREWRFTMLNAAAEHLLGHPRGSLIGRTIWEAFPATVGNEFEAGYRTAVETQQPQTLEAYYPAPLDAWYDVLCWPTPEGLSLYFADVTARKRATELAERAAGRLALLVQVNTILVEATDVNASVARLPRLLVPALADGCIVTLLDEDGHPRDIGSWHVEAGSREVLQRHAAVRQDVLSVTSAVARVLVTGEVVRRSRAEELAALPPGEARDLLATTAVQEAVVLPVRGRDRVLGALTLFRDAGRRQDVDDELTARDIAQRTGLVLDNARLAAAQERIAVEFQRTLLTRPPEPDHAQIVVRYVPASEAARVGGDWYDAFMQPSGATMLVIGDVVGHDVTAAAAMAQLRGLLRGIATFSDAGPAEALAGLESSMALLEVHTLATAAVARLEQTAEEWDRGVTRLVWANAGHPPPLVVEPGQRPYFLQGERADLLLGVRTGVDRAERTVVLPRGTTVLFFTDGLFERRDSPLDEGMTRLQQAAAQLAERPLDELCDGLISQLVHGRPDDDVAVVAVRLHRQDRARPAEAGPNRVPPRLRSAPPA
ncbi:SpoIIE family protein phosphatase [Geodermatophilus nigrescens]|uniref:SpoIIE family protein phosphatase n=1 Tax=Geodermatophilus nigrescens TaxID=1070870 RepID=UPI001FE4E366|nr:SpoIIE family protein phosphatase [Geodermatophilus nigrescens]